MQWLLQQLLLLLLEMLLSKMLLRLLLHLLLLRRRRCCDSPPRAIWTAACEQVVLCIVATPCMAAAKSGSTCARPTSSALQSPPCRMPCSSATPCWCHCRSAGSTVDPGTRASRHSPPDTWQDDPATCSARDPLKAVASESSSPCLTPPAILPHDHMAKTIS